MNSSKDKSLDVHQLYELKLMEQVEDTPQLSNRQASKILGVSVKLAHELLSRMVTKGYFHITKHHARRWDYFLTPKGIAEKARLTYEFLDFSMQFYREARRKSAQVCKDLSSAGKTRVALLGSNELAEICNLGIQEWELELVAVYDDTEAKRFLNIPIQPLSAAPEHDADAIIICLYDPQQPQKNSFLPATVQELPDMYWIFA